MSAYRALFYVKHPDQWDHVEGFMKLMTQLSHIEFYQPSPVAAPWHWQCVVNGTTFNFWPHKNKWNEETAEVQYGWADARRAIRACIDEGQIDLIED